MKTNEVKGIFIAIFTVINAWLGTLAPLVYLLLILQITDYITGVTAAPYRGETRNSDKGFRGIAKKLCMLVLVGLGMALDWLLIFAAATLGMVSPVKCLFAALVAIWLVANEILSILENIGDIGVKSPAFLLPMVKWVQQQAEEKGKSGV
ncbi:phage holin family protein [Oscillospiraceae bacterium LTW-04]|nr:phage holin family protein [Oscillospiraceae bacterium MB24-C1]WMJ84455.1 phage holin family protein [Oscillospiraceae bacterium MB24-C1]